MPILVSLTDVLDHALRDAGIPIVGVSVGDALDRQTWRAIFLPAATPAQKTQAAALLATIDSQDAATVANVKADLAQGRANEDLIRAVGQGLWEAIPAPTMTLPQLRSRILVIYKGLL
jgi:hypothetical protein